MVHIATGLFSKQMNILAGIGLSTIMLACGTAPGTDESAPGSSAPGSSARASSAPRSALDREILSAALDEQSSLESAGFKLSKRVWLRADAYVAEYHAEAGGIFGTQRIGRVSLLDDVEVPKLVEQEKLEEVAVRARSAGELAVTDLPSDRLWFAPQIETSGDIGTTRAASTLDDVAKAIAACQAKATGSIKHNFGYFTDDPNVAPFPVFDWSYVMNPSFNETTHGVGTASMGTGTGFGSGRGSAGYGAVCAGAQTATLTVNVSNAAFGLQTPGRFTFQATPLVFVGFVLGEGFLDHDCGGPPAACGAILEFNAADMSFRAAPGNDIRAFTGRITDHVPNFNEFTCGEIGFTCPRFTLIPEATNAFFVH